MMSGKNSIALFGGTFDPVHKGHITPLLLLADQFDWSEIHLIPTYNPPHKKQPLASHSQRLAMLEQIIWRDNRLRVNAIEINEQKPSRTYPTLLYFKRQYPAAQLFFVLGMDSFIQLDQWQNWQKLTQLADLVVLPRQGYQLDSATAALRTWLVQQNNIHFPDCPLIDISATQLRQQIFKTPNNTQTAEFIYPETLSYIQEFKLYQTS